MTLSIANSTSSSMICPTDLVKKMNCKLLCDLSNMFEKRGAEATKAYILQLNMTGSDLFDKFKRFRASFSIHPGLLRIFAELGYNFDSKDMMAEVDRAIEIIPIYERGTGPYSAQHLIKMLDTARIIGEYSQSQKMFSKIESAPPSLQKAFSQGQEAAGRKLAEVFTMFCG